MGSLESESSVTIRGSGEATEEIVITSHSIAPDNSVEMRLAGVLLLIGLPSDDRSTKKTSDSVDEDSKERFMAMNCYIQEGLGEVLSC